MSHMRLFRPNIYDTQHSYVRISSYVSLTLASLGVVGNLLSIKVMKHRELRSFSCTVFFTIMAISDSVVLVYEVMDDVAYHVEGSTSFGILYGSNAWRCRFGVFFYECSRVISSWLVVALAAELCMVAVNCKLRTAVYSTDRALYVSMAVVLVSVAGCFPFLVISSELEGDGRCTSKYKTFFEVYQMFVLRCAAQAVVPFLLVAVCSCLTLYSLRSEPKKERSQHIYDDVMPAAPPKCQAKSLVLLCSFIFVLSLCPSMVIETAMASERYFEGVRLTYSLWDPAWYITQTLLIVNYSCKFYLTIFAWPNSRLAMGGKSLGLASGRISSGAYKEERLPPRPPSANHKSIYDYSEQRF